MTKATVLASGQWISDLPSRKTWTGMFWNIFWPVLILTIGTIIGVLGNLYSPSSFNVGPLATWISGAASTSAVLVALRGQGTAEKQRERDRAEKSEAAAYQLVLKIDEIAVDVLGFRKRLREEVEVKEVPRKPDSLPVQEIRKLFYTNPTRGFMNNRSTTLSDPEEYVLARSGMFEQLKAVKGFLHETRNLLSAIETHNQRFAELEKQGKLKHFNDVRNMYLQYDWKDERTLALLEDQSTSTFGMIDECDRCLALIPHIMVAFELISVAFIKGPQPKFSAFDAFEEESDIQFPVLNLNYNVS